jgi:hypothetical protein
MEEGTFRILRALGDGRPLGVEALARSAGEAPTVARALAEAHPEWFEIERGETRLTQRGLAALAREWVERSRSRELGPEETRVLAALREAAKDRGLAKGELDQVHATLETTVARARLLVERGDVQRGLCLLGDDDMTSVALSLLGVERPVTVIDVDQELLDLVAREAASLGGAHRSVHHDLREPLPPSLRGKFGCVFTDPPYAVEGFRLFVSRAIELLRDDGVLYVCFGASRRAPERGLQKQRVLLEAGLWIDEALADFNAYEGADSIGARSTLFRCRQTPQTRSLASGRVGGDLYTRRRPRRRTGSR